jgi:flagellar biosynthetic protein FliR
MSALETLLVSRFVVFTLVLARTSALVMTAPIFGSVAVPRQARALLAVTMSLLVTPVYLGTTLPPLDNLPEFGRLLINEVLIGLLLGLGVSILFSGIQIAGQIVSQMSGLSLADVFDPGFDEEASVFSQLFYFLTLAVFVAVGGHRILTQALLETLGIRASAPLLAALTLATLVLGLISRTLPQINIIAIGFGLSSVILMGVLFLSIGAVAWAFQDPIASVIQQLQETVTQAH